MYFSDLKCVDSANAPGISVSLYVSGCHLHCPGCFSTLTWDFCAGKPFTYETKSKIFEALDKPYINNFVLLGGNPVEKEHAPVLVPLVTQIRQRFPHIKIWIFSGYTIEELIEQRNTELVQLADVLVDGPYIEKFRNINLKFRGSSNQRVIDIKKTKETGKVVLYLD